MAGIAVLLLVLLLASFGVAAYGVSIYNGLVQIKHQVERAWSNIDVLLKQRHDELPKLLDAVKGYMTHERALLNEVTALRAQAGAGADSSDHRVASEQALSQGVSKLLLVAEYDIEPVRQETVLWLRSLYTVQKDAQ